ncbi:acyltransferase [Vibrio vulnificus]|nr:acyltransferase [Vibrio vulnificus]
MKIIISFLYKIWLRTKFRNNLIISSDVIVPLNTMFIIDDSSHITIQSGCVLRSGIELRATNNSILNLNRNVKLDKEIRIIATNKTTVNIGTGCKIGLGTVINGGGNITVGEKTLISGYVYLQSSMHEHTKDSDIIDSGYTYGDINIGKGSWIGVHSVIFPNVELGERTIVGSNAVVTKSSGNKSVLVGVPAKRVN